MWLLIFLIAIISTIIIQPLSLKLHHASPLFMIYPIQSLKEGLTVIISIAALTFYYSAPYCL